MGPSRCSSLKRLMLLVDWRNDVSSVFGFECGDFYTREVMIDVCPARLMSRGRCFSV